MQKIDYKLIADTTYDWEYFIDSNGKMLYCSPSCERITGYTKEEFILDPTLINRIVSPEDSTLFESVLGMNERLKLTNEIEYRVIKKNGSSVWIETTSKDVFDEEGKLLGIRGSSRDINERKNAEEDIKRFFSVIPDMACIASADGRFIKVNREWEKVLGYSYRELLATSFAEYIHPDDKETTYRKIERQFSGSGTVKFTNRFRAKDGTYKWLDWNITTAVNGMHLYAVARDVTQQQIELILLKIKLGLAEFSYTHSLDELLQKCLDETERLTESKIGFFHFVDTDQENLHLQMWSTNTIATMCTAKGKGSHYGIKKAGVWVECFHKRAPVVHNDYNSLDNKKGMPEGHAPVIRELVVPVIRNNRVKAILGVGNKSFDYNDNDVEIVVKITDMVWDLIELKQAEKEMEKSLQEKEILLKEIHHRVKNNFQIITSLLNMQTEMVADSRVNDVFEASRNRIKSMALIHELIYDSEIFTKLNTFTYLGRLIDYLRNSFIINDSRIAITYDIDEVDLQFDKLLPIGLIVNEVISNSYKHAFTSRKKGEIFLSFKRKEDDKYLLSIKDNGIGLPPDFDISKNKSLGLYLVQTLTKQIKGELHMEKGNPGTITRLIFSSNVKQYT